MHVGPVDKHEEDLQDEAFVFVPSRHLDHEQIDAEVVECDPLIDFGFVKELVLHPLIDFALDFSLVDELRVVVLEGALSDQLQCVQIHLFVHFCVLEGTPRVGGPLLTKADLLVEAPVLHAQALFFKVFLCLFGTSGSLPMTVRALTVRLSGAPTRCTSHCVSDIL